MSLAFAPTHVRQGVPDQQSTVQKLLDENSQLITKIKECQDQARAEEAVLHQQLLHRNLMMLARLADHSLLNQLKEDSNERRSPSSIDTHSVPINGTMVSQCQNQTQNSISQNMSVLNSSVTQNSNHNMPNPTSGQLLQGANSNSLQSPSNLSLSGTSHSQPMPSHIHPSSHGISAHPTQGGIQQQSNLSSGPQPTISTQSTTQSQVPSLHSQHQSQLMNQQYAAQNAGQTSSNNSGMQYNQMVMQPQPYSYHHQGLQQNMYQQPGSGYIHHDVLHQHQHQHNSQQGQTQSYMNLPR